MSELLPLSIGIGLAASLLLTHFFGLATGGLVVPGYIALCLTRPTDVGMTIAAALATYGIVRMIGTWLIVYGRRRTALMILVGYLIGTGVGALGDALPLGHDAIGHIIPGLLAVWMDRQGTLETLSALLVTSAVTRLVLSLCVGGLLLP